MLLVSIGNVSRWPSLKAARNTRLRTDVISRFKYFSDALRVYESFFFQRDKVPLPLSRRGCSDACKLQNNCRKIYCILNKAVIDRRLRPRCSHLGSYFKRPRSSPVRPLACNWYYCAQFIAKPKAACALGFSWAATSSNLGL